MSGHSRRIADLADSGAARVLSATWRSRAGLQQESREAGKEFAVASQGTETEVSLDCGMSGECNAHFSFPLLTSRREQWPMFSSYACWQQLIQQTKSLARDHATLADVYSTQMVQRLQSVCDDCQRIYKKCREVGYEIHEEILRVLQELHTTMKTYHSYQGDCKEAEKKLRAAEVQRAKIQQSIPKEKLERNKKFKVIEKEVLKVKFA